MRTGTIQNHDLNISAGSEKTKVFVSTNFMRQTGVVPTTDYTKGQLRFNLDQKITSWFKVGLNTSLGISTKNDPGVTGLLRDAVTCSPLGSVYDDMMPKVTSTYIRPVYRKTGIRWLTCRKKPPYRKTATTW
ncbi:MAG: hypothetical protein LUD02_05165 [Tannerellaceae bacterium]|nr:hypothetical protein [Tannerellaceae bacterium]